MGPMVGAGSTQRQDLACGFTLVELLVVVAIAAVLASIGLPLGELAQRRQKEEALRQSLVQLRGAIDAYKRASDEGRIVRRAGQTGYPPDLNVLVEGVPDAIDPLQRKLYFLRRVPPDPFVEDSQSSPVATWGLRSYESPADAPRAGSDVYDVYSRSDQIGLNGVPYRQW